MRAWHFSKHFSSSQETNLQNVPNKFVISIIQLLEDYGISSFIRMTLKSAPPEGLLDGSPVRIQTTELGDSQHWTVLGELPLREKRIVSWIHVEFLTSPWCADADNMLEVCWQCWLFLSTDMIRWQSLLHNTLTDSQWRPDVKYFKIDFVSQTKIMGLKILQNWTISEYLMDQQFKY